MDAQVVPTENASSQGQRTALVIGVNGSAQSHFLDPLKYADQDAREMADVLRSPACGFVVHALINEQALAANIQDIWLDVRQAATNHDLLLLYFSGHAEPLNLDTGHSDIVFITHDYHPARARDNPARFFTLNWLQQKLAVRQAGDILVILDCCYGGNAVSAGPDPMQCDVRQLIRSYVERRSVTSESHKTHLRVILTAAGYNEKAYEHRSLTRLLLPALRGEIRNARDESGAVVLQTLHSHIQQELPSSYLVNDITRRCILARYARFSDAAIQQRTYVANHTVTDLTHLGSPYLGLSSFTYEDQDVYVGRTHEIRVAFQRLIDNYLEPSLLFVTGLSGSGKSSFIQAGVVPALERHYGGSQQFIWQVLRPSKAPLGHLYHALKRLGFATHGIDGAQPENDKIIGRLLSGNPVSYPVKLLVIDQFEELFTLSEPSQRDQVLDFLETLPPFQVTKMHVMVALRADYQSDFFHYGRKALYEQAKDSIDLWKMREPELREAITVPLRRFLKQHQMSEDARCFEQELVNRLARDTAAGDSFLPLLQVTLQALWHKGELKSHAYVTLTEAITEHAEDVYQYVPTTLHRRSEAQKHELLALFLDLVEVTKTTEAQNPRIDVRRRRPRTALEKRSEERRQLIKELCDARLLNISTEQSAEGAVSVVEIIHDTLIKNWQTLNSTIESKRNLLETRAEFERAWQKWVTKGREEAYLLSGGPLREARELQQNHDIALENPDALQYLTKSLAREEGEQLNLDRQTFATQLSKWLQSDKNDNYLLTDGLLAAAQRLSDSDDDVFGIPEARAFFQGSQQRSQSRSYQPYGEDPSIDDVITPVNYRWSRKVMAVPSAVVNVYNYDYYTELAYNVCGLPNPYLGLAAFTYAERHKYAGRDRQIAEAIAKLTLLREHRTVLFITGTSGSGKSSFVQAGVLPALVQYYEQRGQDTRYAIFRPSRQPIAMLSDALLQLGLPATQFYAQPETFVDLIQQHTPDQVINIIIIDQFEEVFTQSEPSQRDVLVTLLEQLPSFPNLHTHLIITLRADFLPELFQNPVLYDEAKKGINLRVMTKDELKQAIQHPLQQRYAETGKSFEAALLDRLATDAASDASYLPLLQATLEHLWEGGYLKLSAYGSLTDAIQDRAEAVYTQATDQNAVVNIFLDLVEVSLDDDTRRDVRCRRTMAELTQNWPKRKQLVDTLVFARLLSKDVEHRDGQEVQVVDIIHESLVTKWPRLREAIAEQRDRLQQRARFELAISDWEQHDRADAYLLSGGRLAEAETLFQYGDVALRSQAAQKLFRQSVMHRGRGQRRQLRTVRSLAVILLLLVIIILGQQAIILGLF